MPELAYSRTRHVAALSAVSDRDLLAQLQADDELALDELVKRKTRALLNVVYRVLADWEESRDVVQMTFVRIWESRSKYSSEYSPNTWIYRIATNLAIDHLRSRRSRDRAAEPLRLQHERRQDASGEQHGARLGDREVQRIFDELAAGLSERQRAVFVLREIEGLSSREVAEIVGCRESTVRNHLFHARSHLRRGIEERYPEYLPAMRLAREDA
jgi:RNA polymerase sigma-70 factor (ECF subfamily)